MSASAVPADDSAVEIATLAGGCFWCLEAVFREIDGVVAVVSGYMGGTRTRPTYREVCAGDTGHAEVVRIRFEPKVLDYRTLLEAFFAIHDPTTRDRQGNDVGSQYRSAIFFHSPQQRDHALGMIRELEAKRAFADPVVTEVLPSGDFWPAEDYHQEYFAGHSGEPYCTLVIAPKLRDFRRRFAARLRR
ncbi:MAG TPA: peptide-methionine (S)-S-oxide reductase [Rhodocyclaceae bacterium]|nr:peptide-methionine (S)-S-oxide reductase [Rhodocyclaceae bacterium]